MPIELSKDIIEGCKHQQRNAQQALHQGYYSPFLKIVLRYVRSKDEAEEILSMAFLKIFNKINTHKTDQNFEAWMKKIVINTALDYLKSEKKYAKQANIEDHAEDLMVSGSKNLEEQDLLHMIHALPDMQKKVFNLFALEGYSHAEISDLLHISEANSKYHLFAARKTLQTKLNQVYHEY